MRRSAIALALPLLAAAACGSVGSNGMAAGIVKPTNGLEKAAVVTAAPTGELAAGFNNAGFDLLRILPTKDNTVLSPTSIGHALLMARAAADEPTGTAIDQGFTLPDGIGAHDAWNSIDQSITNSNNKATSMDGKPTPIATVADRIWPRQGLTVDPDWIDLLATHHGAGVETIDVDQPEQSRNRVNSWVSKQTNELIPTLLPEGFINGNTELVLTDAVYFKAEWQTVFGKYGTIDRTFTNLDGTTTPTSFMRDLEQQAPRGIGEGWAAAELPYLGGDYSMLLIIPDDFEQIRHQLSQQLLDEIDATIESGPYELLVPKWETKSAIDLLPWLTDMGAAPGTYPSMGDAFIGGAVHAAVITVDETGTEAAAATALSFVASGPPEPEFTIAADRPFFYLIRHVDTGLVLFAGQITNL